MSQAITIRDVEASDLPALKAMIDETWEWVDLVESQEALDATIGLYLNQVLYGSSFGKVALLDGKIVGAIFGAAEGEPPTYRMLQDDGMDHTLTLLNATENERRDVYECISKINSTYADLLRGKADSYDGSLVFLAVSEAAQGLGLGKKLWQELRAYFEANATKSVYVYTDTDCNYQFYESVGFRRSGEQDLTCTFRVGDWDVRIFLYEYQFD